MLPSIAQGGIARGGNGGDDAVGVGDRILEHVERLGLRETISQRGVGWGKVCIIAQRAMGGKIEGPVYRAVTSLGDGLYSAMYGPITRACPLTCWNRFIRQQHS